MKRLVYNAVLAGVVLIWLVGTWPHFRPMLRLPSVVLLMVLGVLANLCYCAAYAVDVTLQLTPFAAGWRRWRWSLWVAGTLFAVLLECYWIADEIYPYVS